MEPEDFLFTKNVILPSAILGALGGVVIGFYGAGIGGAIVGCLIGAALGAIGVPFVAALTIRVGLFVLIWAVIIGAVWGVIHLWGVGRP